MPRLGVLGTMVWDTIHARDPGREGPVEEWGGISYALSAFEAAAPDGWTLFPIVKVGADLRRRADRFLRDLGRVDSLDGVVTVPEPNNRVELSYRDEARRCERLTGGVPGWEWEELQPLALSCDAMYVNFIAGWEMDLACARTLRREFPGALYADVHSLLLGVGPDGVRVPRRPRAWREWIGCFHVVQLNEDELATLAAGWGDPWALAADVVGEETRALLVTRGARGAAWVATADFWRRGIAALVGERTASGVALPSAGPVVSGTVESEDVVRGGDPTGCGDVWGITFFTALLGGEAPEAAVRRANRLAARNVSLRGASRLARLLRPDGGLLWGMEGGEGPA